MYVVGMEQRLIERAQFGDLSGMQFAGLVRLSFELPSTTSEPRYATGRDIKGRDEQAKDCRRFIENRSGLYVYTYEEPDTSAYKRKRVRLSDGRTVYRVVRPVFEAALEDLKRGKAPDGQRLDGLIVYDIDRLTRDNRHLEDCIEVVQHFGRPIIDITGTLDLLTDNGRTVARIVVATYNKQSADTARRVRRKHRALEQAGIPTGGRRPFGWDSDKRTVLPQEAAAIKAGAARLLAGAPLGAVVADWNAKGLVTASGRQWVPQTVKNVFRNPRVCGYRSRNVRSIHDETGKEGWRIEVVLDDRGQPVIGQWQPILTVAEWEAVTAIIGSNAIHGRGRNTRTYLMTGTLRCGKPECGAVMRALKAHAGRTKTPGLFYYTCESKPQGGCGGMSIAGPKVDAYVSEAVIAKFELEASRRSAKAAPVVWSGEAELAAVREQIADLTSAWRARQIQGSRYFALLQSLEAEERTLTVDRDRWLASTTVVSNRPVSIRADWPNLPLVERRAYIEEALAAVIVAPANGSTRWNPNRLQLIWRE
jgi:DNA invertase Pin-like site-specific DNA recombinase